MRRTGEKCVLKIKSVGRLYVYIYSEKKMSKKINYI